MGVDICYVVSHGFAARMVLQSTILPHLRERGVSVAVALPDVSDESIIAQAQKYDVRLVETPEINPKFSYEYLLLRRYFFEDVRNNPALWSKHVAYLSEKSALKGSKLRLYGLMNRLSMRSRFVQTTLGRWDKRLQNDQRIAALLEELQPRLLVSTYPVEPLEARFLHEAQRLGIPTVGHLLSWDNITTKWRFPTVPEYFLAWGPIMRDEIEMYYHTAADRIYECGVAHFDHYFSMPDRATQVQVVAELGLNTRKPYLFFGMSSPFISPYEIDVVEELSRMVQGDVFGPDLQLIVRPHPQNVRGHLADLTWLPRLKALAGPRVAVDMPSLETSKMLWSMKPGDLPHLANLIAGCAVCINSGSTLSIDAMVLDRPVICTGFDAAQDQLPWWKSVRRMFTYSYMKKLVDLGGVSLVDSFEGLRQEISAYLAGPNYRAAGRARTRSQECGPCDGKASLHVAEALVDVLARTRVGTNAGPVEVDQTS